MCAFSRAPPYTIVSSVLFNVFFAKKRYTVVPFSGGVFMSLQLTLRFAHDLSSSERKAIIDVCTQAYGEDFTAILAQFPDAIHLLAHRESRLVSHACWVTRWLQPDGLPLLKTAYVEAVATVPAFQRKGIGSAVMQRVAMEIQDYALGGLCAAHDHIGFYRRLGWEIWCGPKAIRTSETLIATPDEDVMILRTAKTPPLNIFTTITAEWREGDVW
jgi:aminoglycoside 2'-N-acetyltransferase I